MRPCDKPFPSPLRSIYYYFLLLHILFILSSMESETISFSQSLQATFAFLFFFVIFISLCSFLIMSLRRKLLCNCDTCRIYITSNWFKNFNNLCDWYTHLLQNSPAQTIHIHLLGNTITANPANVEYILKTRFDNYPKGKPFSMILGDLLGNGIFNVDGDSWRFQRKMVGPALGNASIQSYAFNNITTEIKSRLLPLLSAGREGGTLDLQDVFRRFSFDNICKFSFGFDPGWLELSLPISHFADSFDLATKLLAERAMSASPWVWKIKRVLNIGSERRLKEAIRNVDVLAKEVIDQKRKLGFATNQDLLSRFMANTDNELYLRDIVISFILAGRDSVASALTCFFWLLSTHPEVESKIRHEFDQKAMKEDQEFLRIEEIRELHYLNAAIHESMRLYPPIQFDSKFAREDDTLPDGTRVKKGTRVTYHPYAMGRMETIWGPDFMDFKPERWLKNGVFCPGSPFKYPVFQAGIRVCLGKELALLEMKCVAVSVLRRFDVKVLASDGGLRFEPGLTATVRGGLPVVVSERRICAGK